MLSAVIRPVETRTLTVSGESGEAVRATIRAQLPEGWDITSVPLALDRDTQGFTSTATIVRRDGVRTIEAADMDALRGLVPDGWQMLSVIRA